MPSKEIHLPNPEVEKPKEVIDPIKKLFIANRGEIAVRAIKACIKQKGISAVVTYHISPEDNPEGENSLARRMAEKKGWKTVPIKNYMDQEEILEKAKSSKCDAIFLGYGLLSENCEFVKKCEEAGLKVLAPPSQIMENFIKDKVKTKETAKMFGIKVLDEIRDLSRLDYPVMLKIPNSGGGKGNFVAYDLKELIEAYGKINGLNPDAILVEPYIENAFHVEIQIVADKYGHVVSLGERDCTMQRQHQKVIEESPSPHITEQMRNEMQEAAIKFAKQIGYQGIGTWEFIVGKDANGNPVWYFMEVNQRIQVEHGVTEKQTGHDIVELQIGIAEGKALSFSQEDIKPQGYTIEVRLCAEKLLKAKDGRQYIVSCPGTISKIYFPEDEHVRVDTGVEDGDEMSPDFDSLIAKIIFHGDTRQETIPIAIDYLKKIIVEGIGCNKELLIDLLKSRKFRNGNATTAFVGNFLKRGKEELDRAKKKLKEQLKKAKRKLGKKAIIFRRSHRKKHNGKRKH